MRVGILLMRRGVGLSLARPTSSPSPLRTLLLPSPIACVDCPPLAAAAAAPPRGASIVASAAAGRGDAGSEASEASGSGRGQKKEGKGGKARAAPPPPVEEEEEEEEEVEGEGVSSGPMDFDEEGEEEFLDVDDETEESEDEPGFEEAFEVFEDPQAGPAMETMGLKWAEVALTLSRAVLDQPHMKEAGLLLYAFRAIPAGKKIDIRLDKLSDTFGSPSLDDVEAFSRDLVLRLEQELGESEAGSIELEVSSPGAERPVRVPEDLDRFKELPMRVEFELEGGRVDSKVFNIVDLDTASGMSKWSLADVRLNRGAKGRPMSKKQRSLEFDLPVGTIRRVNLYLDV